MGIIDRYIGKSVLLTSFLVLTILLALTAVFAFIAELDDVGRANYDLKTASLYILLRLPTSACQLFAPAVLLGSLLGLGTLATHNELIVMRASGISIQRIIRSVLQVGFILMLLVAALGEFVAPQAEQLAQKVRLTALSKRISVGSDSGLWLRSGGAFVNVQTVMPDRTLIDIRIFEVSGNKMLHSMKANSAHQRDDKKWVLKNIEYTEFGENKTHIRRVSSEVRDQLVSKEILQNLSVEPESLSARNLIQQVTYLNKNQLDSSRIQLALWTKLSSPLATLVMLMLSVPFVFASQRSGGAGQKIFLGIMLGIGYVMINELFTHMGLVYGFPPFVSAMAPLLFFLTIAAIGIKRTG